MDLLVATVVAIIVFVLIVAVGARRTSLPRAVAAATLGVVFAAVCWIAVSNVNEANGALVIAGLSLVTLVLYWNAKRGGAGRRS